MQIFGPFLEVNVASSSHGNDGQRVDVLPVKDGILRVPESGTPGTPGTPTTGSVKRWIKNAPVHQLIWRIVGI